MPIARSGQKEMESLEEMLDRALVASVEGKSHHRNVLYTYARRCGMRAAALVGSFNRCLDGKPGRLQPSLFFSMDEPFNSFGIWPAIPRTKKFIVRVSLDRRKTYTVSSSDSEFHQLSLVDRSTFINSRVGRSLHLARYS
jgi:hypothetical protein